MHVCFRKCTLEGKKGISLIYSCDYLKCFGSKYDLTQVWSYTAYYVIYSTMWSVGCVLLCEVHYICSVQNTTPQWGHVIIPYTLQHTPLICRMDQLQYTSNCAAAVPTPQCTTMTQLEWRIHLRYTTANWMKYILAEPWSLYHNMYFRIWNSTDAV